MTSRIVLIGGTGLVGTLVTKRLAEKPNLTATSLVRTPQSPHERRIDFDALFQNPEQTIRPILPDGVDAAISCLGTTIRKAGSQPAMWKVDHDYVAALAKGARAMGATHFILVSSVGAGGAGFYLQTKGAIERAVADMGFSRVDLIRPGILLGKRSERRIGEALGQALFPLLRPVLRGSLSRYQAIAAETVADSIVALTEINIPGVHIHHNDELRSLAGQVR